MTPDTVSPRCWRDTPALTLSPLQKAWLCQPGALTTGLRRLGDLDLHVRRELMLALPAPWAREANIKPGTRVWWREIIMNIRGVACVRACSFTPGPASLGAWKAMRGLGQRPLADILYQDLRITRGAFRFGQLKERRHPTGGLGCGPQDEMEVRHSIFKRLGEPLLVAEYFLPAFWVLATAPDATRPRRRFRRFECEPPARQG